MSVVAIFNKDIVIIIIIIIIIMLPFEKVHLSL
jgi:hypothetical protein